MTTVEVFDPPMCCSTGVCGPSVDPALATFAADLQWAGENGATVTRYNLAQEPGRFAGRDAVGALLAERGEGVLPVVVVDGEVRSSGRYPARAELAAWALPAAAAGPEELASGPASARDVAAATTAEEPSPAAPPAGACCGGEAPAAAPAEARAPAGRIAELPLVQAAVPCCGSEVAAEQAGCCG